MNKKISVVISAFNEEKHITSCLESVKWANEIIFVDNSSTDKTAEIAKKHTKKIFTQKNDPSKIDLLKNFGIEKATSDWVLVLDADEIVSEELAQDIEDVLSASTSLGAETINGFWIPRKNFIFGKWIEHTGWYPDAQLRLFRKGHGKFVKEHVHEHLQVDGESGTLRGHIIHNNFESVSQFIYKHFSLYAPNEAEEKLRNGYIFDFRDAIRFPLSEFLRRYFVWKGYKDGFYGLMLSLMMAFYHLTIFAYIWEKKDFEDISTEKMNDGLKGELKNVKKEFSFWMSEKMLEEEKNALKKVSLRIKRKMKV